MCIQDVLRSGLLRNGSCAVQDESAGLVVGVVDPQPGDTVIDCCAAPGGKALFLASKMKGQGRLPLDLFLLVLQVSFISLLKNW
jgi:16S rRNA (cytosine967-C5)-methyltransferase